MKTSMHLNTSIPPIDHSAHAHTHTHMAMLNRPLQSISIHKLITLPHPLLHPLPHPNPLRRLRISTSSSSTSRIPLLLLTPSPVPSLTSPSTSHSTSTPVPRTLAPLPEKLDPQNQQNQQDKNDHYPRCDHSLLVHPTPKINQNHLLDI